MPDAPERVYLADPPFVLPWITRHVHTQPLADILPGFTRGIYQFLYREVCGSWIQAIYAIQLSFICCGNVHQADLTGLTHTSNFLFFQLEEFSLIVIVTLDIDLVSSR